MAEPNCNKGTRSRRNCYPQWDNFPCWDEEMKACYNNEGTRVSRSSSASVARHIIDIYINIGVLLYRERDSTHQPSFWQLNY